MANQDHDLQALRAELDTLRADFGRLTETLREVSQTRARAGVKAARAQADRAKDEALHMAEDLEQQIGERPFTSVLAALGVGFVLGRLLDR